MLNGRLTIDTNILVYSIDCDAGQRHDKARHLLDACIEKDCVLTAQALSEFFYVVTRKNKMPFSDALAQIEDWQVVFPTIVAQPKTLNHAINAVKQYHLAFWDAMLWAVAKESNVTRILSEDFQHQQIVEGVEFFNPLLN